MIASPAMRFLIVGGWLSGCGGEVPPPVAPVAEQAAAPADEAPAMPLAEALYAGELGPQAEPLGDRVRILLWLRSLELDATELEALRQASLRVRAAEAAAREARARTGAEEEARLRPVYEALARELAVGRPSRSEAKEAAAALVAARKGLPDPRKARGEWVRGALDEASAWSATLDERQRAGMASALFFLRLRVSADLTPELYTDLLGNPWQAGDFASLRRSRSGQQEHLDVGGLFTLEGGRQDLIGNLDGLKLDVLVAIALAHPDLAPSVEVLLGRRDPLDLGRGAAP